MKIKGIKEIGKPKQVKGCVNVRCQAHQAKITYAVSENYCSRCGEPLQFVCRVCYVPLDGPGTLCALHQTESDERRESRNRVLKSVGIGVLSNVMTDSAAKGFSVIRKFANTK